MEVPPRRPFTCRSMDNSTKVEGTGVERTTVATDDSIPEGLTLSLNSSRLKGAQLRLLAEAMNLPTKASIEETRQLIEGALGQNREPAMVQVIIQERRKMVSEL